MDWGYENKLRWAYLYCTKDLCFILRTPQATTKLNHVHFFRSKYLLSSCRFFWQFRIPSVHGLLIIIFSSTSINMPWQAQQNIVPHISNNPVSTVHIFFYNDNYANDHLCSRFSRALLWFGHLNQCWLKPRLWTVRLDKIPFNNVRSAPIFFEYMSWNTPNVTSQYNKR